MSRGGDRMPSVRELATLVGVSVKTLRAAQALLAKDGLLEIRHGSGVYLTERARPLGVGIYSEFNILQPRTSSFHSLVPHFLREFLEQQGVQADIYIGKSRPGDRDNGPSNTRFRADVENGRLDAVAILNAPSTSGWGTWAQQLAIPAVGMHTPYQVQVGYGEIITQAVRRLALQGSRRIAMLAWYKGGLKEALHDALNGCGLDFFPEWIRHDLHPMLSGAGWEEFREIWMARREKPDGLLVADDMLFDEARIAIQELGIRVPEELQIVTHANKGAARRYPFPVTEIQMDPQRHAEALGNMLLKRLRGEAVEPSTVTLPFEMVEAAPVAAPVAAKTAPRIVPHEVTVGNG
jgi:DNA-binding LacI/PurR family transcriptional regulator